MTNTEKSLNRLQPEEVVIRYYKALNSGDLESIKCLMTQQSYYMTLESLGLKLAFKDLSFKQELENIEEPDIYPVWIDTNEWRIYIDADDNYLAYYED